ncbi:hypothetical protein [Ensifer sp. M14]|uniref:hypothetical protein n=1 Tax=Ensifer sp. M14 TaxID=2203782 RepID=UPI000E1DB1CE|nr:hypothetical protein [Ensifer sp. M14]
MIAISFELIRVRVATEVSKWAVRFDGLRLALCAVSAPDMAIRARLEATRIDGRQRWVGIALTKSNAERRWMCRCWKREPAFWEAKMSRRRIFHMIRTALLNRLLLVMTILMIASLFSVLIIKGALFKDRQESVELDSKFKFAKGKESPFDRRLVFQVGLLFVKVAVTGPLFQDHA